MENEFDEFINQTLNYLPCSVHAEKYGIRVNYPNQNIFFFLTILRAGIVIYVRRKLIIMIFIYYIILYYEYT
jgi:hypothetical protein